MRTDRIHRRKRRGAATVEFALTVPLVLLFFMASVEFGRVYMVRQTLEIADRLRAMTASLGRIRGMRNRRGLLRSLRV